VTPARFVSNPAVDHQGTGPLSSSTEPDRRFVGIDLAWGENGTTGLAVSDSGGALLDVTHARTDQQIESWMGRWASGPTLVAIDAPLIVRNSHGQRPCERLVGRYFGKYQAFCHSSNMTNPNFVDGGRGLRLSAALGLDVDPDSGADRRAIEVYPHPAIVALFRLPRIIRYKNKPGRDFPSLHAEMSRLLGLVESLEDADVPLRVRDNQAWTVLRAAVAQAVRKSELGNVEDDIDAVVCAYIAAYHHAVPQRTRVLGSYADGYIVTPVQPETAERIDAERL
jgi:predicted RNase H-like nuclease